MADLSAIFGGTFIVKNETLPPEMQFTNAIEEAGLYPPPIIEMDRQIHRFNPDGKPGNRSGWYVVFPGDFVVGVFGNWKTNTSQKWYSDLGRPLTPEEESLRDAQYMKARKMAEEERTRVANLATEVAVEIWEDCAHATAEHPYLVRKQVQPHGARVSGDGRLVLPLYDEDGNITTLQFITGDGGKQYLKGAPTKGKFWLLGEPTQTIYIAEGFATAASIREASGCAVAVAYTAGNLTNVTGLMRERFGAHHDLCIVADNDESGTGQREAAKAAERWGARVITPPIIGDANDYAVAGHDLHQLLNPPLAGWLVSADEFSSKPAPISWLVKKWIQSDALIMVHGPSGAGKSFIVLDWCMRVASGLPSWDTPNGGYKVRKGNVVYLAGEGHWGLRARVAAWKHFHGVDSLDMWLSRGGCDLNVPDTGYRMAVDHIRALPKTPNLIVVDTLHRFLAGDENKAQDARTMLDACAGLMREFKCSVILVHHTGVADEAQTRARGSSAWRGALDVEISVVPKGSAGERTFELIQRKQKDSELEDSVFMELRSVPLPGWIDEDGEQVSSAVPVPGDAPLEVGKDSKLTRFKKMFERAWFETGCTMKGNAPHLSKEDLVDFLITHEGYKESTAQNMAKPSQENKLVGYLQNMKVIELKGDGWAVIDNTMRGSMLTRC